MLRLIVLIAIAVTSKVIKPTSMSTSVPTPCPQPEVRTHTETGKLSLSK